MRAASAGVLFVKNLAFTVLVPGTVAVWVPYRIATPGGTGPAHVWPAAPIFLLGLAVYAWCLWDFAVAGRGTPAPIDPPRELVVRGLYRGVRNPMYLGVLMVVAGWAVCYGSCRVLAYGAVLALAMHGFVRGVEERLLRRRFGAAYDAYCRAVPRWWPRVDFRGARSSHQ